MPRLPQAPDLEWRDDGTPVARGFDDVYFSVHDGLAEARAVFLGACGLPERWQGRDRFTIAETGFGTGLNFLAAWQAWARSRAAGAWLHFVSFEGHPLLKADAARALSRWPEVSHYADKLLAQWPHGAAGVRRLTWPDDGVTLTVHMGEISQTLPRAVLRADAWFLDGFSPAKNPSMWGDWLYPLIAERSASGARAATFTVAGAVRRGLTDAGFSAQKAPGYGRKRQRLEAVLNIDVAAGHDPYSIFRTVVRPKRMAVIGAGIAGANVVRALLDTNIDVSVFDAASLPASGASGNALALVMPRLDAADTVQARLLMDAYLSARATYVDLPGVTALDVRQSPRNEKESARFAKVLNDPPLPLEDLEALSDGGMLHKGALAVRPAELIEALLEGTTGHYGAIADVDLVARTVNGDRFDAIVLANAMAAHDQLAWTQLVGRLGQVEHVRGLPPAPASALAAGHYAISVGGERLWGATFEAADGPPVTADRARLANTEALEALAPWWVSQVRSVPPKSRAGIRATTSDRLPLIGAVPDFDAALGALSDMRSGRQPEADGPVFPGIYMVNGFGSRGFTWGPWAAAILAAELSGAPAPAERAALEAVSPMRLILRGLKRGEL